MKNNRLILLLTLLTVFSCTPSESKTVSTSLSPNIALNKYAINKDYFSEILADGFDYPIGDANGKGKYTSLITGKEYESWYIATKFGEIYTSNEWIHPGEDWNGKGGGNTDLGQPVHSIGNGKVIFAGKSTALWGNIILLKHTYLENGFLKTIYSQYSHLRDISVKKGAVVKRRQIIGTIGRDVNKIYYAHLHFEIRKANMESYAVNYWPSSHNRSMEWVKEHYEHPSEFIEKHRQCTYPLSESKLVIVTKRTYKMHIYEKGKLIETYHIALSQEPEGPKRLVNDLKLPEGEYKVCLKKKGPFGDAKWWYPYLGDRWININYPNEYDALWGLGNKYISKHTYGQIINALKKNEIPPKNTKLGGGIGIHGWIASGWKNDGDKDLTWGCISMHKEDLLKFYDWIDFNIKIIILP
ncbi:peptidoglycan DD-metalloendopeptidase family protein [bacterium]|nr:peptidoglycan DD-metalloendopeptidase family protein [bacterium]